MRSTAGSWWPGADDELVWRLDGLFVFLEAHDNGVCAAGVVAFADEGDAVVLRKARFLFEFGSAFVVLLVRLLVLFGPRQSRLAALGHEDEPTQGGTTSNRSLRPPLQSPCTKRAIRRWAMVSAFRHIPL